MAFVKLTHVDDYRFWVNPESVRKIISTSSGGSQLTYIGDSEYVDDVTDSMDHVAALFNEAR